MKVGAETGLDAAHIARIAHEANRAYRSVIGEEPGPTWEDSPQVIRDSVVSGVVMLLEKPETTPRQSHEAWAAYKVAEGWIYGPEKDVERRTHPQLVAYDDLPAAQRVKDELFRAIVLALAAS